MSKRQIIIVLGALVIIIALFSGLPNFWNKSLYILTGLAIIAVAYTTKAGVTNDIKKMVGIHFVDTKAKPKENPVEDIQVPLDKQTPVDTQTNA